MWGGHSCPPPLHLGLFLRSATSTSTQHQQRWTGVSVPQQVCDFLERNELLQPRLFLFLAAGKILIAGRRRIIRTRARGRRRLPLMDFIHLRRRRQRLSRPRPVSVRWDRAAVGLSSFGSAAVAGVVTADAPNGDAPGADAVPDAEVSPTAGWFITSTPNAPLGPGSGS